MVYYEDIGGEGGIRTHGARNRAQRFSKPSHSTALAPLLFELWTSTNNPS